MRSPLRVLAPLVVLAALLGWSPTALAQEETQAGPTIEAAPPKKPTVATSGWQKGVNDTMTTVNGFISDVFFFPIPIPGTEGASPTTIPFTGDDKSTKNINEGKEFTQQTIPFAVLWLVLGALFFTFRMAFVQLRLVGHAIQVTRGKYDNPDDAGEVSHFQALSAALSATVGLGNIAGVAIAVTLGGPGATFWMIVAGFLGMASKFTECSLGQIYRKERSDGSVMGGAMYYLSDGLREKGMAGLGKFLAVFFAILCIGGSLAGGNSFQVNQSLGALGQVFPVLAETTEAGGLKYGWIYGAVMTGAVGFVILGGLQRIADVATKIVPTMCAIYVIGCVIVIGTNASAVGPAFQTIWDGAFNPQAGLGGIAGVLIVGFQRAAFSNEAGVGSAAIAHSAAKSHYPVREGIVALLEPLIDTILICTMTALVIVITGAYMKVDASGAATQFAPLIESKNGAGLTAMAFGTVIPWFPKVLAVAVVFFAFSTMISWSYYGERCFAWLFGDGASLVYKVLFLTFTFLGSIVTGTAALEFGDLMILGMAIPNVVGVVILSGKVKEQLDEYLELKRSGQM